MSKTKNEAIRIIPLGGVGEIGKNMYVVEVDHEIFIIDAGLMFPENEMLGIDIVIPDIQYLIENKDRVKGIFLTHGHEDSIGAISYVLSKIKAPVYGTKLTNALVKSRLKDAKMPEDVKFFTVHTDSLLNFDGVQVSFFRTTHSIPDSVGVCIHTSEGAIVHTGEFKFDQSAKHLYRPDLGKMAAIGDSGVLCLLSDSTEAERPGYTTSEGVIANQLTETFRTAKGRIIVACFASNLIRLQQVFDAAEQNNRKVAVVGKSLKRVYDVALKLGYLHIREGIMISLDEIEEYPNDEIVIVATGNQGEPFEALQRMAKKSHRLVNITSGDTVLITATPSPGMEVIVGRTINMLYKAGADVLTANKKVHVSGHGSQEDLKFMLNIMKPKHFVPIQGEYKMLVAHSQLAHDIGLPYKKIFILDKGDVLEYKDGKMKMSGRVQAGNVLIDGSGVGDVGNIVLRDRKLLSEDGVFTVVVTINRKTKAIVAGPEIISRGFVYVRESEELIEGASGIVTDVVQTYLQKGSFEWSAIKQDIRDQLNYFLFNKTRRRPMILPIIMEV
ncbi:Zn-dependent hydrolase [[Bacillus] enclensis]|uniref:Ribonuclease J n=2 Tax=Rossellomorea TaxID=2837508 RepID=A0A0V8HJI2_9BACI|nr:ribonuclease J [[Bacillus] enclensis]KSU62568.1 Zn-dependent hydrolase [[Bacillus] enclensis]OAT82788.1 Zn-dependent hydrolase [Bacillus sp. MKU004]QWC24528.1 ribonuclease J [Bacillus haikouensis]SCC06434.1 ribonuclease J [[Bacillus] enclensis]